MIVYVVGIIGIIICIAINILLKKEDGNVALWTSITLICTAIVTWLMCLQFYYDRLHCPTAMDVYNGNTTIQYNYTIVGDSTVCSDSIVVFKK